jgi:hypothetical protein
VRAGLATNGRETNGDGAFLILGAEDIGRGQIIERIGADKFSMSTAALGMDDSFWDTLPVEMRKEVN